MSEPTQDFGARAVPVRPHKASGSAAPRGWLARAFGLGGAEAVPSGGFDFKALHNALTVLERKAVPGE